MSYVIRDNIKRIMQVILVPQMLTNRSRSRFKVHREYLLLLGSVITVRESDPDSSDNSVLPPPPHRDDHHSHRSPPHGASTPAERSTRRRYSRTSTYSPRAAFRNPYSHATNRCSDCGARCISTAPRRDSRSRLGGGSGGGGGGR